MHAGLHACFAEHRRILSMDFILKSFKDLTGSELFEIYKLRNEVFIVEQNCAYQDVDDKDLQAFHVIVFDNNQLIAYSRILPPGLSYPEASIGRVLVKKEYRMKRTGYNLMKYNIKKSLELFNNQSIVISAQLYLLKFYTELHFVPEGEPYLEDGIPHIKMRFVGN